MALKYCYPHIDDLDLPATSGNGFCWRGLMREHDQERERIKSGAAHGPAPGWRAGGTDVLPDVDAAAWEAPSLFRVASVALTMVEEKLLKLLPWVLCLLILNVSSGMFGGRTVYFGPRLDIGEQMGHASAAYVSAAAGAVR